MPTALPATAAANALHADPAPCVATAPAITSSVSVSAGTPRSPNDKLTKMTAAAWRDSHASASGATCMGRERCHRDATARAHRGRRFAGVRDKEPGAAGNAIVQRMDPLSSWQITDSGVRLCFRREPGRTSAMLDRMLSTFFQDLRFAVRLLRRSPRDTAIAAAILGLGIGANTAMFSAINHVLWRPFPFRDEARLIRLREMVTATDGSAHPFNMSSAAIVAVRESARDVFEDLVAMSGQSMTLAGADAPERVSVVMQTEGFDRTLGVAPLLGRPLTDDEARRGLDAGVALVGHAMWDTRFARSPAVIGSRV